jgi:hypothetical protein
MFEPLFDPWAITDDMRFQALIWSDNPIDDKFVNMIPSILEAEGIQPNYFIY